MLGRGEWAMQTRHFGIDLDDLRIGVKDGLRAAAELEFPIVEFGAVRGDATPETLTPSGRRHLRRYAADLGLTLSALTADLPGYRLTDSAAVDERVHCTRGVLELAREIGVPVVATGVGMLTHPETGEPSPVAMGALRALGEFADSRGVVLALRPSGDSAERIGRVLKELSCPAIRVCADPAASIMHGVNPLSLFERIPDRLALVHARDGTCGGGESSGRETTMGEGEVDWRSVAAALNDADYTGGIILRRTDAQRPRNDLAAAREFLKQL